MIFMLLWLGYLTIVKGFIMIQPRHYQGGRFCESRSLKMMTIDNGEQRSVVVVGLNSALQRRLVFSPPKGLEVGRVNRASKVGEGVGGKGQNVCVALRQIFRQDDTEMTVTLAQFSGGRSGTAVCDGLMNLGVKLVNLETAAHTRTCTSLIDKRFGETTEITEPWSGPITEEEQDALLEACSRDFACTSQISGMAFMGSVPDGVSEGIYAQIMTKAAKSASFSSKDTKVMVDSVNGVFELVETGYVGLLKVNAEELVSLAQHTGAEDGDGVSVWMEEKLTGAALRLFAHLPQLPCIAVTNGPLPAYLFCRSNLKEGGGKFSSFWRLTPPFVDVVNPIGAGDAVAAAMLSELTLGTPLPQAFRVGLATGCASCLSRDPLSNSCFDQAEAKQLVAEVKMEEVRCPSG
ncbi:unnamed protein product [Choristocarpus tenellus]